MVRLYNVDSPINREQRNNLNSTFEDILNRFSRISYQIGILSGGEDVEEILNRIEESILNANNAAQEARDQVANALTELQQKMNELNILETSIMEEISNLRNFVLSIEHRGLYNINTQYSQNNEVLYDGSTYRAKRDNINSSPPNILGQSNDDWQLIARRGTDAASESVIIYRGVNPPSDNTLLWLSDPDLDVGQEISIYGGVAAPIDTLSLWLREGGS